MSQATEPTTTTAGQVLEFDLGEEAYCVSIDHVTEIVDKGDMTGIPNAPAHVEGMMDLRGNTTTIVDPKELLDLEAESRNDRIIVFDPALFEDDRSVGWLVDGVREVTEVAESEVDESPVDDEYVTGVINRTDGFVVWLEPKQLQT